MDTLTEQLKGQARELGFVLTGVTLAASPGRLTSLHAWLDRGFAGEMQYIEKRLDAYTHPNGVLEGCRSLLMLGFPYGTHEEKRQASDRNPGYGRVARYACSGADYHDVIHQRLKILRSWLERREPNASVRGVVDTAPLLEREFAELAGLGWVGKNTLLLNRQWGSYFFLAALLTDLELDPDEAEYANYCGTCTACLDQCPTRAFPEPFVLDATRCLSYLTIEHRSDIDSSLAEHFDEWVFGCDICQEVCPWNRKAAVPDQTDLRPQTRLQSIDVLHVLNMDDDAFRKEFRATPMWRSRRRGLLRNAILLAGNQQLAAARPILQELLQDREPLIRAAAAWALARMDS